MFSGAKFLLVFLGVDNLGHKDQTVLQVVSCAFLYFPGSIYLTKIKGTGKIKRVASLLFGLYRQTTTKNDRVDLPDHLISIICKSVG